MDLPDVPFAADEPTTLNAFLDYYRAVLHRKLDGVTPEGARLTVGASDLTLIGLVKHMALVEDAWFQETLQAKPMPEPWASAPFNEDPDWEWHSALDDDLAETLAVFEAACERSRVATAQAGSLDTRAALQSDAELSLRWILVHMIEEYARHCGHADLLRQTADGAVGD